MTDDSPSDKLLHEATFPELIEELSRRSEAMMLGLVLPGPNGNTHRVHVSGDALYVLGLSRVLQWETGDHYHALRMECDQDGKPKEDPEDEDGE